MVTENILLTRRGVVRCKKCYQTAHRKAARRYERRQKMGLLTAAEIKQLDARQIASTILKLTSEFERRNKRFEQQQHLLQEINECLKTLHSALKEKTGQDYPEFILRKNENFWSRHGRR
jgi:hypothetical protein